MMQLHEQDNADASEVFGVQSRRKRSKREQLGRESVNLPDIIVD